VKTLQLNNNAIEIIDANGSVEKTFTVPLSTSIKRSENYEITVEGDVRSKSVSPIGISTINGFFMNSDSRIQIVATGLDVTTERIIVDGIDYPSLTLTNQYEELKRGEIDTVSDDGKITTITDEDIEFTYSILKGAAVTGTFAYVEGYIYWLSIANHTSVEITLENVGVNDENGDAYDPVPTSVTGAHVAAAIQYQFNTAVGSDIIEVEYTSDNEFLVRSLIEGSVAISFSGTADNNKQIIGMSDEEITLTYGTDDYTGKTIIFVTGVASKDSYTIYSIEKNTIVIGEVCDSMPEVGDEYIIVDAADDAEVSLLLWEYGADE